MLFLKCKIYFKEFVQIISLCLMVKFGTNYIFILLYLFAHKNLYILVI